jgi:hypothetical protein
MRKLPSIKGLLDGFNTLLAKTAVAPQAILRSEKGYSITQGALTARVW